MKWRGFLKQSGVTCKTHTGVSQLLLTVSKFILATYDATNNDEEEDDDVPFVPVVVVVVAAAAACCE